MIEDRRTFLGLAGAGALAAGMGAGSGPAAAQTPDQREIDSLKADFLSVFAGEMNHEKWLNFLEDNALVVAHDVPFPLDKAGYTDHMQFHSDFWESREFLPEAVEVVIHGTTGVVSCYFNERGKPVNAGFRQRPGFMTVYCNKTGSGWRAIGLHTSSLRSQIVNASPS